MNRNATNSHLACEASLFGRHPSGIPHDESESPFKTPRVRSKPLALLTGIAQEMGGRLREFPLAANNLLGPNF